MVFNMKKIRKQFGALIMLVSLVLGLFAPSETVCAATGSTSVSVSSGSVNIGDSVTVTVKASGASGEKAYATMTLSYDASILQFVSCSVTYGGGGGSVTAATDSFTVTFQAVAAGTSSLSVSANDGVLYDTNEELDSMSGSSASVTVNNAAGSGGNGAANGGGTGTGTPGGSSGGGNGGTGAANLSADNSLKSLTISPGTLSPAFTGKTTKYSATVANEVTSIAVTATPANEKAVVESVTGNSNLAVGSNTVKVVVKAENGVTATYTINVTRQGADGAEEPQDPDQEEPDPEEGENAVNVTVNGISYHSSGSFAAEDIPVDFSETAVNYHGQECKGVRFDKGSVAMLYLVPETAEEEKQGSFFVFDEVRDTLYPFVKLNHGEKYMIALLAPVDFAMPESFIQTEIKIDGENAVTAFQKVEEESEIVSDFYFIYGVNQDGTESWYRYDDLEGTYQRCNIEEPEEPEDEENIDMEYLQTEYAALSEKYREEKAFARNVIGILVFVIAVLVIIIINMLIFGQRRKKGPHDDDDLDDDITDFNDL